MDTTTSNINIKTTVYSLRQQQQIKKNIAHRHTA